MAPAITPRRISHHPEVPAPSIAGTIKPRVAAASMIPAQYPIMMSDHLWDTFLTAKPMQAPIIVEPHRAAALIQISFI
jgi:hypothetical protein